MTLVPWGAGKKQAQAVLLERAPVAKHLRLGDRIDDVPLVPWEEVSRDLPECWPLVLWELEERRWGQSWGMQREQLGRQTRMELMEGRA
jgi:hypothetical protein